MYAAAVEAKTLKVEGCSRAQAAGHRRVWQVLPLVRGLRPAACAASTKHLIPDPDPAFSAFPEDEAVTSRRNSPGYTRLPAASVLGPN